jgi:RHS repeat-associated protein
VFNGINLSSGNFSTSATDLSFEGGYGIPVNVTRSYSANNPDEGPFGKGWTLSADVRSTAGGLLKSGPAPVRSVPVAFRERPSLQLDDPNAANALGVALQPVSAVLASDAGGKESTVQRDVDGILTTPPWDKNTSNPTYEFVTLNGQQYQVLIANKVTTPDGTVYYYYKRGSYPNGTKPWNDPSAPAEAANVLKVSKAVDRQGNETTYVYGATPVTFAKSNGTVSESPLVKVQMPNGHAITFVWGDGSAGHPTNRVWKVRDNNSVRTVTYGYDASGMLTSATTPGGKTTAYGYGPATVLSGSTLPAAQNLLTSVTDPRGLVTTMAYVEFNKGSQNNPVPVAWCRSVTHPNGTRAYVDAVSFAPIPGGPFPMGGTQFGLLDAQNNPVYSGKVDGGGPPGETVGFNVWGDTGANMPFHQKVYDLRTQDLITERDFVADRHPIPNTGGLLFDRKLVAAGQNLREVRTDTAYNFMGNPLKKTVEEANWNGSAKTSSVVRAVEYSYWGKDKYYQQKATKDQAGRYSYTDYYTASDQAGRRGQTHRVYDAKHAGFVLDSTIPVPANTASDKLWKYRLRPSGALAYAAQFEYDAQGRVTDVWKLQSATTSPWTYVQTKTTYGADTDGSWGQASQVVEDYGTGGVNRTTTNNSYTSWGVANNVTDAAGRIFVTSYDLDGQVLGVTCNGNPVASYTYGPSGTISHGMVTSVTDSLSGVVQTLTYSSTPGGSLGQVSAMAETRGGTLDSTVSYTYNGLGERDTATYVTPSGTTTWRYTDYVLAGSPQNGKRVFQTLRRMNGSNPTAEEFHYAYDSMGRLREATFAQTPKAGFTPSSGNPWYDSSNPAASRARAHYEYDAGGRATLLAHYWDTWNSGTSSYSSELVHSDSNAYELTGLNRGLKTSSSQSYRTGSGGAWTGLQSASYGYEAERDFLTSASYGDGLPTASATWAYDAAGNRTDTVADNLNRPTSVGGVSVTIDVLGNRLTKGSTTSYGWDAAGRMTSLTTPSGTTSYAYRADGMRITKSGTSEGTVYRYDGQMGMQDVETSGTSIIVNDYALGARGVDAVSRTDSTGTAVGYPLYDAHGNRIATLTKSGPSFGLVDVRSYDAWGQVRQGARTGRPRGRYVASIGHVQDDESGLIYMRARYYEPGSGRFVSEDPARDGRNWYIYAKNNPITTLDPAGKSGLSELVAFVGLVLIMAGLATMAYNAVSGLKVNDLIKSIMKEGNLYETARRGGLGDVGMAEIIQAKKMIEMLEKNLEAVKSVRAAKGLNALVGYGMVIAGYALMTEAEFIDPYSKNDGLFGQAPW